MTTFNRGTSVETQDFASLPPKQLIVTLSETLLARFDGAVLVDRYAVYQLQMDYWAETMQDDVYLIVEGGGEAGRVLRELQTVKGQKSKETPDLVIKRRKLRADLIPPALIVARYFAAEQAQAAALQALDTFIENHIDDNTVETQHLASSSDSETQHLASSSDSET